MLVFGARPVLPQDCSVKSFYYDSELKSLRKFSHDELQTKLTLNSGNRWISVEQAVHVNLLV